MPITIDDLRRFTIARNFPKPTTLNRALQRMGFVQLNAIYKDSASKQLAKVYGFTDVDGSQPDAWRYVVEVQEPGKPADATGYR